MRKIFLVYYIINLWCKNEKNEKCFYWWIKVKVKVVVIEVKFKSCVCDVLFIVVE